MPLSTSLLATKADCDVVLGNLNTAQKNYDYKRLSLEKSSTSASKKAGSLDSNIASVSAEITSLTNVLAGLPDGPTKVEISNRITKAQYKLFTYNQSKRKNGTTALVWLESQLNDMNSRLALLATDVADVTARKAAVPA